MLAEGQQKGREKVIRRPRISSPIGGAALLLLYVTRHFPLAFAAAPRQVSEATGWIWDHKAEDFRRLVPDATRAFGWAAGPL